MLLPVVNKVPESTEVQVASVQNFLVEMDIR